MDSTEVLSKSHMHSGEDIARYQIQVSDNYGFRPYDRPHNELFFFPQQYAAHSKLNDINKYPHQKAQC